MKGDEERNQEHQRYARRLAKLEAQSAAAFDRRRRYQKQGIGSRVVGIKRAQRVDNSRRVLSILVPFLIIMLLALYIVSPLSKIKNIQVTGNQDLSAAKVESAAQIKKGALIWRVLIQQKKLEQTAQKANPQVKSLKVSLTGPQSIKIKVAEYPIIGVIEHNGVNQLLIGNGRLTPVKNRSISNFVRYAGFEHHEKVMQQTARQIGRLPAAIRGGISEVTFAPTTSDTKRLRIYMNDGNEILVRSDNLNQKMRYYPSIASKMKANGVVDLQYGAFSYSYGTQDE
ncbi:FtsQ-type POTRA domain-containing protein [Limosilactobacillus sp. WILCCON 0053]|uniref:cell division protein FtsQ/DivIB n=1 Tax=Limosilactobacillus allomucosae TaxID=3142938 RepID=UPI0032657E0F